MNPTHAAQRMRSAIAPVISAGVITANVSWNATNARSGTPSAKLPSPFVMSFEPGVVEVADASPRCRASPNASE